MADYVPSFSQPMPCGYAWVNCALPADLFLMACADLWASFNGSPVCPSDLSALDHHLWPDSPVEEVS